MHTVHSVLDRARNFNTSDLQGENRIDDTGVMIGEAPQGWSAVICMSTYRTWMQSKRWPGRKATTPFRNSQRGATPTAASASRVLMGIPGGLGHRWRVRVMRKLMLLYYTVKR